MRYGVPPVGGDVKAWAHDMRRWIGRMWGQLPFKDSASSATEDGAIMWDAANGYPVVSKSGAFVPLLLEDSPLDYGVKIAELEILNTYGDTVSVLAKRKTLLKFGRNENLGTSEETVWTQGGNETYVTTNAIDTISSSNAGDTQVITIEGHTVSGTGTSSQFTFVSQSATLNGQNKVVLSTPVARVSRLYITAATAAFAGDVYVYEDDTITAGVPSTASKIHMKVAAGETQSFKAATTFSNGDYFICTGGVASVGKKASAIVDLEMQVRTPGGVFRPVLQLTIDGNAQSSVQIKFYPYAIIPKNSDIRITGVSSAANTDVSASFQGFMAAVQ